MHLSFYVGKGIAKSIRVAAHFLIPFIGWRIRSFAFCIRLPSLFAMHRLWVFVVSKSHEARMPQVIVWCPLCELKLPDQHGL